MGELFFMAVVPGAFDPVQQPSVQFNNPVSESSLDGIAASVNGLLGIILPVGSLIHSMLDPTTFASQLPAVLLGSTWVLADGRNVSGSAYANVTGHSTVPDFRGGFLRGKNNGRSDGQADPHGDLALGTYEGDQFSSHNHHFSDPGHTHTTSYLGTGLSPKLRNSAYGAGSDISGTDATGSNLVVADSGPSNVVVAFQGGAENNPKSYVVNIYIRIN